MLLIQSELRLHHLLQREPAVDHHGRALYLQHLLFLEIRKQARDGFTRGSDNLGDLSLRQSQLDLR